MFANIVASFSGKVDAVTQPKLCPRAATNRQKKPSLNEMSRSKLARVLAGRVRVER